MARTRDHYISAYPERFNLGGREFSITTHWASVDGRAVCVGVDVRSFTLKSTPKPKHIDARPTGEWSEVTSPILRAVKVGAITEQHRKDLLNILVVALAEDQRAGTQHVRSAVQNKPKRKGKRPGPPEVITDDVLATVVVPAYNSGGRTPVEAVRAALKRHRREPVTRDQAAKAVVKARSRGFLPPSKKGSKKR